jgi:ubiquinone/menaquinone biosynthesis C-methylase UbiE
MELLSEYYEDILSCYLLGKFNKDFISIEDSIEFARSREVKLNCFKKKQLLERVEVVIGYLKGINPNSILDIGIGHMSFLCPVLNIFPKLNVTTIDTDDIVVDDVKCINIGGTKVSAYKMDAINMSFDDNSFDIVTALEVLEHIKDYRTAIKEICRVARKFVIVTVPSKPDENPWHLHLFTDKILRYEFQKQGLKNIKFEYVLNHIIMIGKK